MKKMTTMLGLVLMTSTVFAGNQVECFVRGSDDAIKPVAISDSGSAIVAGKSNGLNYNVTVLIGKIALVRMSDTTGASVFANLSRNGLTDIQLSLNENNLICKISEIVGQ